MEDLAEWRLREFWRMKPLFEDCGRCNVENEERSELIPSEATSDGGEDGSCSWNGSD